MLSKRGERKEGKHAKKGNTHSGNGSSTSGPSANGSSASGSSAAAEAPTPDPTSSQLLALLLERNLVTDAQIDQAFAAPVENGSTDLGGALLRMGFIDERELIDTKAEVYGMEVANLRQATPEVDALRLIPDSMAREHFVIPVKLDELGLHVAMADQPTSDLLTLLGQASGRPIKPMLAPLSEIRRAIDNNYRAIGGLDHLVQAFEAVETTRKRTLDTATQAAEIVLDDDAPVVQVVGRILTQAMRDRASDVHIEPTEDGLRIRYRIDGALEGGPHVARIHGRRTGSAGSRSWPA